MKARHIPTLTAILIFAFACITEVAMCRHAEGGTFIYPLDDTYIMMSIAKNLSQSGVWGVTRHEFTSATSTPLYTAILAATERVTSVSEWWPIVLSILASIAALMVAGAWLGKLNGWLRLTGLLALVLLVPLFVVAITGMEHCLHIALSLLFLWLASEALDRGEIDRRLLLLAPTMVMVRFESLFLIGICGVAFMLRRRFRFSLLIFLSAFLALGIYAAFSLSHGWAWLPNPILMKGQLGGASMVSTLLRPLGMMLLENHIGTLFLALVVALTVSYKTSIWDKRRIALLIGILAFLAHLEFARVGWVYRYEAYLLAIGVVCLFASIPLIDVRRVSGWISIAATLVAFASLGARAWNASSGIRKASFNIYEQQYQMGRFVEAFYPTAGVAANDIGWITYSSDIRLLDLTGLANRQIFFAKRQGIYTTNVIESEADRVSPAIAIVYDSWFASQSKGWGGPALPSDWIRVERWRVYDSLFLGDSTVSFYAIQPRDVARLRESLNTFSPSLPSSVAVLRN